MISGCNEFRPDLLAGVWNSLDEGFITAEHDLREDRGTADDPPPSHVTSSRYVAGQVITLRPSGVVVSALVPSCASSQYDNHRTHI